MIAKSYPVQRHVPDTFGVSTASRVMKKHGVSTAMRPANKLRNILVHPKDNIKELDRGQESTKSRVYPVRQFT